MGKKSKKNSNYKVKKEKNCVITEEQYKAFRRNRKAKLKKILVISFIVILIIATVCTYSLFAFADTGLSLVGKGAIIYCDTTDEVIYEKDADTQYNIGGLASILTCYIAYYELGVDYEVLCNNQTRKCIDVIYNSLINSDKKSAKYLAEEVAGDEVSFLDVMTEKAKEWGCTNFEFGNANGVDGYCTASARDVAIIASHVFSDEVFREICQTETYTLAKTEKSKAQAISNDNLLMVGGSFTSSTKYTIKVEKVDELLAGKVAVAEDSYSMVVEVVDCDGLECYCVVLRSTWDYRYSDAIKLINYAKQNTQRYDAFKAGDSFGEGKIWHGKDNMISGVAKEDGTINLPEGASGSLVDSVATFYDRIDAPVKKGDKIGEIVISIAGDELRNIDLVAEEDMDQGWFLSGMRVTNTQTVLIFLLLFVIVALFAVIIILRSINRKKYAEIRHKRLLDEAQRQINHENDYKARNWPYR